MSRAYERNAGPLFYTASVPNYNGLAGSMVSDYNGEIRGTDPASFAAEEYAAASSGQYASAFPGLPKIPKLPSASTVGRAVVGVLVALILLALGAWIVVKQ